MRRKVAEQLGLVTATTDHVRARELTAMSGVLDALPRGIDLVHRDLVSVGGKVDTGREAMTAEQVLRAMVAKQRFGCSYEGLAFLLADSSSVRAFCRIPLSASPPTLWRDPSYSRPGLASPTISRSLATPRRPSSRERRSATAN